MGLTDWFRRVFSSSTDGGRGDDMAVLRGEPAEEAADEQSPGGLTDAGLQRIRAQRGATGFTGLEVGEAVEEAVDGAGAPPDPAP
jgi:hypothetical protein